MIVWKQIKQIFNRKDKNKPISKYKIPIENDGIVRAVCANNYDGWLEKKESCLKIGKHYIVEYAVVGNSTSQIYLSEFKGKMFNLATLFRYYINGKPICLIEEARIFWNISQPELLTRSARILKYRGAKEEGLQYVRSFFHNVPIIDRSDMNVPVLPPIPDVSEIKQFAINGWELGETHGLPHWERVKRYGILLSLSVHNGKLSFRKGINIKVICYFAYLHDKCRLNDYADLQHGERAADMLYTIKETLLKDLNNEEFSLLEQACRLHTTTHKTGDLTIDTCFDADRLDLERVGIAPDYRKMATDYGAYYATHPYRMIGIFQTLEIDYPISKK